MVLLDNEGFLAQVTLLFNKTKTQGTVYVTMKQYHGETKPKPRDLKSSDPNPHATGEPRCLFRATNGKKKYSTVVMHKDVNKFQLQDPYERKVFKYYLMWCIYVKTYAALLKSNIDNLKKRDKKTKKNKKAKATQ